MHACLLVEGIEYNYFFLPILPQLLHITLVMSIFADQLEHLVVPVAEGLT